MNKSQKQAPEQLPQEEEAGASLSTHPSAPASAETIAESSAQPEIPVEVDPNDVSEAAQQFQTRLDYVAKAIERERLVAENSREYQHIMALFQVASQYPQESLAYIRSTLLNSIEAQWDVYCKRFAIPDRLVNFQFTCRDGVHYLSLNRGYLCIYQNPFVKYPVAMPLVWPPADYRYQAD